jgi:hypothetical protein
VHLENALHNGAFSFIALRHPTGSWVLPWDTLGERWRAWHDLTHVRRAPAGTASLDADTIAMLGARFTNTGWIDLVQERR